MRDARKGRTDPTGLGSVRSRYEREVKHRFGLLRRAIRDAIVKDDVLGLKGTRITPFGQPLRISSRDAKISSKPSPGQFAFERSAGKVQSFMDWVRQAQAEGILETSLGTPLSAAASSSWQNVYLQSAYQKGMSDAAKRAGQSLGSPISAAFNQPVHADAAALIYTRAYESLSGVTEVMATNMSRALARSMVEGLGAMDTADALTDVVDGIGLTRARTIARTELTAAYSEATLNSYEEMGLEGVTVEAEFTTADDDSVCPECEELEGKVFSIAESHGVIPVHPNCRCAFLPVVPDVESE
jgi:SPP1 gp7 family putative phage head morphogenesis protein